MAEAVDEKRKVLIVDDEAKLCKMLKLNLEGIGNFEVQVENDPSKAHEVARKFRPAVIIMDVLMPEKRGSDVAVEIRNDKLLKGVKIVFLTALAKKKDEKLFLGVVGGLPFYAEPVLAKPIKTQELIDAIEKILAEDSESTD